MTQQCTHLEQIAITQTDTHVCEECIKIGDRWVHLRMYLTPQAFKAAWFEAQAKQQDPHIGT